ncbi:MAG: hypothetical protein RIS76_2577 [Verrucomicrobiota bacterium]
MVPPTGAESEILGEDSTSASLNVVIFLIKIPGELSQYKPQGAGEIELWNGAPLDSLGKVLGQETNGISVENGLNIRRRVAPGRQ